MAKVLSFPQTVKKDDPALAAMQGIEQRFGMSFWEYMGFTGDKEKVREKIDRVLQKETLQMATKIIEEK
ncbi:hypothetical protein P4H32_29340 [Bacillus cereus]|nr:hypothetical protein [Bacillus cereus]